jgi:predicted RNA methylase
MAALPELVGKRLGCHCKPLPCHGDVLIKLLEELIMLDQHFTDKTVANQLVKSLLDRLDPQRLRCYIEPACGTGAFSNALLENGIPAASLRTVELDPQYTADIHADFLSVTSETLNIFWPPAITVVVGNPPFGHNGLLARRFINKAAEFAHWICLVAPRSMHDAHCCGTLNPRLMLIREEELANVFSDTKAKCNWQEWFLLPEGTGPRPTELEVNTLGLYELVDKNEPHDVVVQRCGVTAGRVTDCNGTGEGKYYVRSSYPQVIEAFKHLGKHPLANKTTHQPSLSARLLHDLFVASGFNQWVSTLGANDEVST